MGSFPFKLFCKFKVILKVVLFLALFIQNIPRIANTGLGNGIGSIANCPNTHFHPFQPIQRIENPEDIYPIFSTFFDELSHQVVRVSCVTNRIASPKKHLQKDIRHSFSQKPESFPRVLMQKTHTNVKGSSSPYL